MQQKEQYKNMNPTPKLMQLLGGPANSEISSGISAVRTTPHIVTLA